jgi:heat-inducible transcriptional repressor
MGPGVLLVVAILLSGAVRQQLLRVDESFTESAQQIEERFNELLFEKSAAEIHAVADQLGSSLVEVVARLLEEEDRSQGGNVHVEGLSYMAGQPEFGRGEQLQPIVEILERPRALDALIEPLYQAQGVYVSIGHEQPVEALWMCSAVLGTYGRPGEIQGVVGVIGPTRLAYWRAVPMVEYVTGLLDRLLEGTFSRDG